MQCSMLKRGASAVAVQRTGSNVPVSSRPVVARAAPDAAAMAEALKKIQSNPQLAAQMAQMQEAMKRPEVQAQMQQMQAMMQNQQMMQRMASLRTDPEFKEMFEDIQKNGMGALMKYYNDPKWLAKIGEKLGDVPAAAPQAAPQAPPEITNLLEAARYGDEEAVEDFIAIGKDVNAADEQGRTPLHYAAAINSAEIATMLLEAGAKLEAVDAMQNTPLHYAAGYGRAEVVKLLVENGASTAAKNQTGKTPQDLIKQEPRNPLNGQQDVIDLLKVA